MPISFAQSMLSFGQFEIKSCEASRFRGSILMRFQSLEPPQFPIHTNLIDLLSNLLRNKDFATG